MPALQVGAGGPLRAPSGWVTVSTGTVTQPAVVACVMCPSRMGSTSMVMDPKDNFPLPRRGAPGMEWISYIRSSARSRLLWEPLKSP